MVTKYHSCRYQFSWGPSLTQPKFLRDQISWGPNFLGTKKIRGPNEIGDHFSYSQSGESVKFIKNPTLDYDAYMHYVLDLKFWLECVLLSIIGAFGFLGNIITFIVLKGQVCNLYVMSVTFLHNVWNHTDISALYNNYINIFRLSAALGL